MCGARRQTVAKASTPVTWEQPPSPPRAKGRLPSHCHPEILFLLIIVYLFEYFDLGRNPVGLELAGII